MTPNGIAVMSNEIPYAADISKIRAPKITKNMRILSLRISLASLTANALIMDSA